MLPSDAIEILEPIRDCDVLAGTFDYIDRNAVQRNRPFYVRTVADVETDSDGENHSSIRQNDANQQLMQAWEMLQDAGATGIHYQDVRPSPFF